MATPITIPVTVTPEAAARVAELGLQRELDEMVKHTIDTIPGCRTIQVVLELPYDTGDETRLTIQAMVDIHAPGLYQAEDQWSDWFINTYPPQVREYINLMTRVAP